MWQINNSCAAVVAICGGIVIMEYKRLTKRKKDGSVVLNYFSNDFAPSDFIARRLAELEDKIENGTLVFIDEPFWSEYHDCWAVFQRTEDIVQTCYMTVNQAKDYKSRKEVGGDKK